MPASSTMSPMSPMSPEGVQAQDPNMPASSIMSPMSPLSPGAPPQASTLAGMTSPLEHILIFGQGRFQRLVLLCTMLAVFTSRVHGLASSDFALPVDHWCRAPAAYADLPLETWKNASVPAVDGTDDRHSHCFRHDPPFPVPENLGADNRTVVPCDAGWDYEPGAGERSIVSAWDLVCGRRWILSMLSAVYNAGGVLGGAGAGILADRVGRRPVLCILIFLLILAGVGTAFAHSILVFAGLRFVVSMAASSTIVTSTVLLFEVTDVDHRALFCALSISGAGVATAIYRELVMTFIHDWHMVQIAYMVPTSALVLAVYLMEESPCWLLATARVHQGERVLLWAARVNKVDQDAFKTRLAALREEMKRQQQQLEHGRRGSFDAILSDQDVRISDLVANETLRNRSIIIFSCWCIAFAMFYSLSTSEVMRASWVPRASLLVLRIIELPFNVYVLRRIGRRLSLAHSMAALSVVVGCLAVVDVYRGSYALHWGVTVLWLLVFEFTVTTLFAFSAELYPTVVRGAGVGFCYVSGRMGAIVGLFLNHVHSPELRAVAFSAVTLLLLFLAFLALSLPETTKIPPANTMRGMMADKWKLHSPLRLARSNKAVHGTTTRRHSKSIPSKDNGRRRRGSVGLAAQNYNSGP
ncbi:solute carrier family 22 member 7-like [Haemaphysalis longicornis]